MGTPISSFHEIHKSRTKHKMSPSGNSSPVPKRKVEHVSLPEDKKKTLEICPGPSVSIPTKKDGVELTISEDPSVQLLPETTDNRVKYFGLEGQSTAPGDAEFNGKILGAKPWNDPRTVLAEPEQEKTSVCQGPSVSIEPTTKP